MISHHILFHFRHLSVRIGKQLYTMLDVINIATRPNSMGGVALRHIPLTHSKRCPRFNCLWLQLSMEAPRIACFTMPISSLNLPQTPTSLPSPLKTIATACGGFIITCDQGPAITSHYKVLKYIKSQTLCTILNVVMVFKHSLLVMIWTWSMKIIFSNDFIHQIVGLKQCWALLRIRERYLLVINLGIHPLTRLIFWNIQRINFGI
jgi:hypothetical protein